MVLVQDSQITDPDHGGRYTVKVYRGSRVAGRGGSWVHDEIRLEPDSVADGYEPIVLRGSPETTVLVIAELVEVLPGVDALGLDG